MRPEEGEMKRRRELHLRRSRATTIFLIVIGVLLAYLCFRLARPFLTAIAWATILAVVFTPIHRQMRLWVRQEDLSAVATTVITLLLGVLPLVWLGSAIGREARQGYQALRGHLASGASFSETVDQIQGIGPAWRWAQTQLQAWEIDVNNLASQAGQYLGEIALDLARGTIANLSSFLLNMVLVTFTLFFFFRDGPKILERLQHLMPIEAVTLAGIYQLIGQVIRAAVYGVVVISLIKGALAGFAFWILGLHSPMLWGVAGAVASVIPVFGISLVWAPAAIVLLVQGHALKALLLVIWGLTALSLIDNFLYPILVRNQIRLHTLVVFFSTLGGLGVFGLLGFVIGPIVATLALTLIEVVSEYYTQLEVKEGPEPTEIAVAEPPK
jgi:predicted PurR-regulated permease PerM